MKSFLGESFYIDVWFSLYIWFLDKIWSLNWTHTHSASYFPFGLFIYITKFHWPVAWAAGWVHPSCSQGAAYVQTLHLHHSYPQAALSFTVSPVGKGSRASSLPPYTVSVVTRALCPTLLWRKGVSDGTSLSRIFLSLTSGSTHAGLTYDPVITDWETLSWHQWSSSTLY